MGVAPEAVSIHDAFERFLGDQCPALVGYLRGHGIAQEDAQDIAQESLHKLTRYRGLPPHVLKVLLYRIALNTLHDVRRREASLRHGSVPNSDFRLLEIPDESPQPEQWFEHREELERVRDAVDRLPTRCREVYLLNRIDGMSYAEISRHCGISVKAVEKHIGKALSSLRERLAPHVPLGRGRRPS